MLNTLQCSSGIRRGNLASSTFPPTSPGKGFKKKIPRLVNETYPLLRMDHNFANRKGLTPVWGIHDLNERGFTLSSLKNLQISCQHVRPFNVDQDY